VYKYKLKIFLIKKFILKLYYKIRYDIFFDDPNIRGSIVPTTGKNLFVKVTQKGKFLDIEQLETGRLIRMIPSVHSNGYMIEFHEAGVEGGIIYRGQMSFNELWKRYIDEKKA